MAEIFDIFECLLPQNPSNQSSLFFRFFRTKWKGITKSKNRRLQGIISAWKWFQILLHSKFSKKASKFWSPGNQPKTWNSDFNFFSHALLHMNSKLYSEHLIGKFSNCNRFWGQNLKKISWKGFKKLNSTIFWALYFFKC